MIYSRKPYKVENLIIKKSIDNNLTNIKNETGHLVINVFHNVVNTPIENATVVISKISYSGEFNERAEGTVIGQYTTDINGSIPFIELPALNELMNDNKDFYIIAAHANGYYSAYVFNVQVYPNVDTIYNIYLSHVSSGEPKFYVIVQPTTKEIHSH